MKAAYVFPGQGSQKVGMGYDLYENFASARKIFDQADEVLDAPISKLCFEGPAEDLQLTINAQPALLTISFACLQAIREANGVKLPPPELVAGHSLGEYTALAVAGVFDFATAVYLARERGRLMYETGLLQPGGMTAIIGFDESSLIEVCKESGTWLANINSPQQLVISGAIENLKIAAELAKARGARRAIPLPVSGAFHTPMMQKAADAMSEILDSISLRNPDIPVIANTTAEPINTGNQVKAELINQLCNGVQWQRSIEFMLTSGVDTFVEVGPGEVLTGLIKRINGNSLTINIGDTRTINNLNN